MKKIIKLTDEDLSKIIEGVLKEQPSTAGGTAQPPAAPDPATKTTQDKEKLQRAIDLGCFKKYTWFTMGTPNPGKVKSTQEFVVHGTGGAQNNTYYFYPDMTVKNMNTGVSKSWTCPDLDKEPKKQLSAEILRVLEKLKKPEMGGWFTEPKPSIVDINDNEFTQDNMADPKDNVLKKYKQYFSEYIENGFPIYRKGGSQQSGANAKSAAATSVASQQQPTQQVPTTLDQGMKDMLEKLRVDYNIVACQGLIDTYFEMAQAGQTQDNTALNFIKDSVYMCVRKNMRNFKNDTKDKLRWLSGNEEDAKNILGARKFKNIGNIRQDDARRAYRLDKLPAF